MFCDFATVGAVAYVERARDPSSIWGFAHVPKTAGSSLIESLISNRGPYELIQPKEYGAPGEEFRRQEWNAVHDFVNALRNLPIDRRYKSFSGHLTRGHVDFIKQQCGNVRFFTLLRDPVDRVISDYRYCLTPLHPRHAWFSQQFPTIQNFIDHPMGQNVMTRRLASESSVGAASKIKSILNGFEFIGTLELYDVSVSIVFELMGTLQAMTSHVNRTVDTPRNAIEIDAALRNEIRQRNAIDDELFQTVQATLLAQQSDWWMGSARFAKTDAS